MRVWQDIVDKKHKVAWILEDDALFHEDIRNMEALLRELRRVDKRWHFCYTGRLSVPETRCGPFCYAVQ